jgi:hypothetical protein
MVGVEIEVSICVSFFPIDLVGEGALREGER